MILKKTAVLLFAAIFFAGAVSAEELTVEDAVRYAMENNISVQKDKITLDSLKRAKNHSWNGVSPSASVSANMLFPRRRRCPAIRLQFVDSGFGKLCAFSVALFVDTDRRAQL